MLDKWDRRFLELAAFIAQWSKDPATKVGAVVVNPDKTIVSVGFNGLPRRTADAPDRYQEKNKKYSMIVHAEMNAILCAPRSVRGCILYTYPFAPCSVCASMVIQAGILKVVAPKCTKEVDHWMHQSIEMTATMFIEANIELLLPSFEMTLLVDGRGRL